MENTPQNPYNSPATANTMATSNGIYVKPTLIQALFSFQGRFSRTQFWINSLILTGAFVALMIVVGIAGAINPELAGIAALLLGIPMYIVVIWASLAISVKRWHDPVSYTHLRAHRDGATSRMPSSA